MAGGQAVAADGDVKSAGDNGDSIRLITVFDVWSCVPADDQSLGDLMDVVMNEDGGKVVAVVRGEVDADNCDEMGRAVSEGSEGASRIVLDLSGLTFIDSSGLGELLRLNEIATERGQDFEIVDPSDPVLKVLEITGLLGHFGLSNAR